MDEKLNPGSDQGVPDEKRSDTPPAPVGMHGLNEICRHFSEFPDPVVISDYQRRIVFLNWAAEQLLGCSLREKDFAPRCSDVILNDSDEMHLCFIDMALLGEENLHRLPVRLRNRQGDRFSLSVTSTLIKDARGNIAGCFAILRDLHEDLLAQSEIKAKITTLSSILKHYPLPFFTVDTNLVITYMNEHLEKLSGFTREQAVGRLTCAEVLRTQQCDTKDCLLRRSMKDMLPMSGIRRTITDRNGRLVPVVAYASILTDGTGKVIGGFEAIRDITHIVEAEEKIRLLTEMSQEGILMIDDHLRILFVNAKFCEMAQCSREELVDREASDILPAHYIDMIQELVRKADASENPMIRFCSTIPLGDCTGAQNGRTFETSLAVSRVGKNVIAYLYLRDLTSRIEIVRQLRKANSFLNNIIQSSADGIVVTDTRGKVLVFNEGAERILGYEAEEVMENRDVLRRIYPPHLAREMMRRLRSSEHGPPGKLDSTRITFISKSGEEIPLNFSAGIIKEGDKEIGSVGIFNDLREHLKMERELEQARLEVLQAEKIASLGRLAAGVAHEINNPLAGILIYADLLMKEIGHNPQWHADMEEIITQTLRCKEIVTRLLEFSRRSLAETILFDVNEVIAQSVGLLCHQALFQDIEIVQELETGLPSISGDPSQIRQVLTNLIINAADAMNGKGRLTIRSWFDSTARNVILQFIDTGSGIDQDTMHKVFEPFFTTKPPGKGTGLGLSIAYGIIQRHGGTIEVESLVGRGTTFTIELPAGAEENRCNAPLEQPPPSAS